MLRLFSQFTLWLVLLMTVWLAGLGWFIQQIPKKESQGAISTADCIVLLTGGKGRLEVALKLLAEGKGKVLFVSGAGKEVTVKDLVGRATATTQLALSHRYGGKPPIILGQQAENTIGNASETAAWISTTDYKSLLLVTSNYHMPRSLNEFHEHLPDIKITPAPVYPEDFSADPIDDEDNRALLMSEYHKFLASTMRHAFLSVSR
jgi:uncharacterized SAM-binding protein YcdF (DUF218 family)